MVNLSSVIKTTSLASHHASYILTPAGEALSDVVFSMVDWGQEWLKINLYIDEFEADHLLWGIRRNVQLLPILPNSFIVEIALTDQSLKRRNIWLIYEKDAVNLCIIDRNFDVDVQIKASSEI